MRGYWRDRLTEMMSPGGGCSPRRPENPKTYRLFLQPRLTVRVAAPNCPEASRIAQEVVTTFLRSLKGPRSEVVEVFCERTWPHGEG